MGTLKRKNETLEEIFSMLYHKFHSKVIWPFDLFVNCFNSQKPFFDHKLCFRSPNGEFNLVLNIFLKDFSNGLKGAHFKNLGHLEILIHKLIIIWECLRFIILCCLAFSHICENVFEFQDIILTCFPSHALVSVMTPMSRSYLIS